MFCFTLLAVNKKAAPKVRKNKTKIFLYHSGTAYGLNRGFRDFTDFFISHFNPQSSSLIPLQDKAA